MLSRKFLVLDQQVSRQDQDAMYTVNYLKMPLGKNNKAPEKGTTTV